MYHFLLHVLLGLCVIVTGIVLCRMSKVGHYGPYRFLAGIFLVPFGVVLLFLGMKYALIIVPVGAIGLIVGTGLYFIFKNSDPKPTRTDFD